MAHVQLRRKAIELRLQGKTYSDIRKELGLAKSTLSDWLKNYPLTEEQVKYLEQNIKNNKLLGVEKNRITKQIKRNARLEETYKTEKKYWMTLSKRELELAGLFLYWGEGNKSMKGSISLNNTDPKVMRFTLYWLLHGLKVPKEKIKIYLHLYSDMNVKKEVLFWSNTLNLPQSQFSKPYIKNSTKAAIDQKGFGHGTCALIINNVRLKERVMMAINAIADSYSAGK